MIKYSDEQLELINSPYIPGHRRNVLAYSGCGKSTSLIGYANAGGRDRLRVLYLAFNKSVANEAKRKFPEHVACMTINGLAFATSGVEFKDRISGKVSGADFIPILNGLVNTEEKLKVLSYLSFKTLSKWFNSVLDNISYECITPDVADSASLSGIPLGVVIDGALSILNAMIHGDSPVSHSLYLKLFQLNKPVLPYDVIMIDEAQDLNPVVMDILNVQDAELIKVGDPYQSIYAFRDAINTLNDAEAETFYLTNTYRFGQNLADIASKVLCDWKGATKPLIGHGQPVAINEYDRPAPDIPLFICRTKAGLLEILIDRFFEADTGKDELVYLPGGKNNYGLGELNDAYSLFKKGEGRGSTSQFKSWEEYEIYSEVTGCQNATTTVRLVNQRKGAIPSCISMLSQQSTGSIKKATFGVTTAHKSKGLEHPYIVLADDFPNPKDPKRPIGDQEINLMYVALTRAELKLDFGTSFKKLIQ